MKVAVIGAGAIGGLMGASLARAGVERISSPLQAPERPCGRRAAGDHGSGGWSVPVPCSGRCTSHRAGGFSHP